VEKVGAKTAVDLLAEHKTLEGVLAWAEKSFGAAARGEAAGDTASAKVAAETGESPKKGKGKAAKAPKVKEPKAYEKNLVLQAKQAREGRILATLDRNVPIGDFTMDHCRVRGVNLDVLRTQFRTLGLRVLEHHLTRWEREKPQLIAAGSSAAATPGAVPAPGRAAVTEEAAEVTAEAEMLEKTASGESAGKPSTQGNLFDMAPHALDGSLARSTKPSAAQVATAEKPFRVQIVKTAEELKALVKALNGVKYFAWDTETTSEQPMIADPVGISLCWSADEAWYIALRCGAAEGLETKAVLKALAPVFTDATVRKVSQNGKYDLKVLRRAGLRVRGQYFDTMIGAFLLDPGRGGYGIDALSLKYLNYTKIPTSDLIGSGKDQITMDQVPVAAVAAYSCEDAWATWRLAEILEGRLKEEGLWEVMAEIEQPLVETLADMEFEGIYLDAAVLKAKGEEVREQLVALGEAIHALAGRAFNIDSPTQLAELLFTELKLPVIRKSAKTKAPSTDEYVLTVLAKQHPLPAKVLEYRTLAKLLGTYIDALPKAILPTTGRVHASFLQTGAATGRLASWNPNLQNIPVRKDQGSAIRAAFKPRPGWKFLACDYSQIELRLLAHYAEDETLRAAFRNGEDIHKAVAARVFHVPFADVTDEQRNRAKAVNFGILYGQGPHGLAEVLGIKRGEAKEIIDEFFARHPGVAECREKILNEARNNGYVKTLKGRKRHIPEIHAQDFSTRGTGERMAVNTVFQGSAADLIKEAMNAIHAKLSDPKEKYESKMLLQIHDELLFETPPAELERLKKLVVTTMEGIEKLHVPLKVSAAVGNDWSEL
ncbi:MAG TPA: DNA polymerase I, partial [Planctomycetota bacterium]|nr:DNA polymerase I [Planctomycetota bacterium]